MNKELFDSMNRQMTSFPQLRAELKEKLAQPPQKRPVLWMKYGALAACAALVIGVFSVYSTRNFHHDGLHSSLPLHSYVTVEGLTGYVQENDAVTAGGAGGDQDMGMLPQDLEQAMLDAGYTQEEVDEYQSIGYQMTWANWWKFVHQQENSEGDRPFNLEDLKLFSQKELSAPSGALPGGALILEGDAAAQEEAVNAYHKLAPYISSHPDWYGGAYIDSTGTLVVCLVESQDPGDKSLELQVLDWTDDGRVAFTSGKYSLGYLLDLQKKVCDTLYYDLGLDFGCGTDEEHNRLDLTLPQVTDKVLALLAELDPDDDAIYVQVGQRVSFEDARDPVTIGEDVTTDSAKTEEDRKSVV